MKIKKILLSSAALASCILVGFTQAHASSTDRKLAFISEVRNVEITDFHYHVDDSRTILDYVPNLELTLGTHWSRNFYFEFHFESEKTSTLTIHNESNQPLLDTSLEIKDDLTGEVVTQKLSNIEPDGSIPLEFEENYFWQKTVYLKSGDSTIDSWSLKQEFEIPKGKNISFIKQQPPEELNDPNDVYLGEFVCDFLRLKSPYYEEVAPQIADWYTLRFTSDESLFFNTVGEDYKLFNAYRNYHFNYATFGKFYLTVHNKEYVFNRVGIAKGQEYNGSTELPIWILSQNGYRHFSETNGNASRMIFEGNGVDGKGSIELTIDARYHHYEGMHIAAISEK